MNDPGMIERHAGLPLGPLLVAAATATRSAGLAEVFVTASVIISVREDERILQCLTSICDAGSAGFSGRFEIIVIENSSEPRFAESVKAFPVVYLVEPRRGMGYARARGIERAKGKYLVFTDADCVVSDKWLSHILAPFEDTSVGIVGGPITKLNPSTFVEKSQRDLIIGGQTTLQYLPPIYSRAYVATANAAYISEAVRRAGGIDPTFSSGGDVDLAWRVGDLGYQAVIAVDALVYHACRPTVMAVFRQFFRYSVGHAQLFKKVRHRTGKRFCVNAYPLVGLKRVVPKMLLAIAASGPWSEKLVRVGAIGFQIVEYTALLAGAVVGAVRHRTPYI